MLAIKLNVEDQITRIQLDDKDPTVHFFTTLSFYKIFRNFLDSQYSLEVYLSENTTATALGKKSILSIL